MAVSPGLSVPRPEPWLIEKYGPVFIVRRFPLPSVRTSLTVKLEIVILPLFSMYIV